MHDEASRLLGLTGLRVTGVVERDGDALDLEVESVALTAYCWHCGCLPSPLDEDQSVAMTG